MQLEAGQCLRNSRLETTVISCQLPISNHEVGFRGGPLEGSKQAKSLPCW
jgi:hypothetical protein